MLTIRQAQIDALGAIPRRAFEEELMQYFLGMYPRECAEAGGQPQIAKLVARGVERAAARGYTGRKQTGLFVALMFILGDAFDSDPQIPWAAKQLDDERRPLESRPEIVFDSTIAYLDATAGQSCEHVVRAMLRIRSYDAAMAPDFSGEAWISGMCDLLRRCYPQKFDRQGEPANRALLELARRNARQRGFRGNRGGAIYATLMFMLGSGFERDLLYPWAAAALNAEGAEDERTDILYRAALAHIENSLTPD